jgi:hypothetical protein
MAFCNSCGANLDAGAKFCPKCGAVQAGASATPSYAPTVAEPAKSSNAVKIMLLVLGAIVVLGILGTVTATLIGLHVARHTRINTSRGGVKIESPLGTVETSKNPDDVAKDLGIDVYPGARTLDNGAASVNMGGTRTVAANFETDDPPRKVADFYRSKFPDAKISTSDEDHYSIVSMDNHHIVTIKVEPEGSKTVIHIANVNGNAVVDQDSKD